jgi:hypothetical protein
MGTGMLEPITGKITDESTDKAFMFTFYCDLCGRMWKSMPVSPLERKRRREKERDGAWRLEHAAAYERANLEAMQHFNRCPRCRRWVCNDCLLLLEEGDLCRECGEETET